MPVVDLPFAGVLLADVALWAVASTVAGWAAHRRPLDRLADDGWLLRVRPWEDRLHRLLRVKRWKDRLPEAGAVFAGGVSKRTLPPGGLDRYVRETRRAELAHWWSLLALPLFVVWNPPAGMAWMAAYWVVANVPCVLVQRRNRRRAQRALARRSSGSRSG